MKKNIILDIENKQLVSHKGKQYNSPLTLSHREIKIICLLKNNPSGCTREDILDYVWAEKKVTGNSLNVSINNIRNVFMSIGIEKPIITLRGFGYRLNSQLNIELKVAQKQHNFTFSYNPIKNILIKEQRSLIQLHHITFVVALSLLLTTMLIIFVL